MNLPKLGRGKLTKGVSLLAVVALAGIGYSSFSSEVEPKEMHSETDFDLEGLADPLFEELFQDKYHRALKEYNESKGIFSCNDICQVHKRRLDIVDRELSTIQNERAAARKAILIRAREQRLSDTQARQAANAERRVFSHDSPEERISVRRLVRKAERDAERAVAITAFRASLGIGDPLTLQQKQARAAAAKEARIASRTSRKTPAEAAADADARQAARWFDYLDLVAQAHCHANWEAVEQYLNLSPEEREALREGNQNDGLHESRANVRATARRACITSAPTPSPTPPPTTPPTPPPTAAPTTPSPTGTACNLGQIGGELRASANAPGGGNYCLRLLLNTPTGSILHQDLSAMGCDTTFTPDILIGTTTTSPGASPDLDLFNGDSLHCPGGLSRSGDVTLVLDPSADSISMVATEPYVCHYTFTVTYPSCVELQALYPLY